MTPPSDAENKAAILGALRATIAIASESGALPLQHKAEAMLTEMLAHGRRADLTLPLPGVRSYRRAVFLPDGSFEFRRQSKDLTVSTVHGVVFDIFMMKGAVHGHTLQDGRLCAR